MPGQILVPSGGYGYLAGAGLPFSNGVVAMPGHILTRIRLRTPLALAEGLAFAASYLSAHGRPASALAACELRSPQAMTPTEFAAFNAEYARLLREHGFGAANAFPVARSNMAPLHAPPATNSLLAFSYTVPGESSGRDFVISGKPENTTSPPGMVAPGDSSADGLIAKADFVIGQLRARVAELDASWSDISAAQVYTVRPLEPVMDLLRTSGLSGVGLTLFPGFPPIIGFEFEIDVRAVSIERVV